MYDQYFSPQEDDFKRWVREVLREELNQSSIPAARQMPEETLLSRQQIAAELGISLVTLTDWMKKGLPYLRLNVGSISNEPKSSLP